MNQSPRHNDLPLADYDHIPLRTLPTRITGLDENALGVLLSSEQQHGDRLPVKLVLEQRLQAVRDGAALSDNAASSMPEVSQSRSGSPVTPASSGPPINPPSQGDPTNPAQPR
ncbi:hypothetical protein [Arthrobacter sp. Br18]|uniref:hypothetical protein n=1 Tax=Arthrobacter sp. Br18 TaxID=1312954 RepID=UPI00047EE7D5|nr:hypothetical protein [Arthrobacter sp. Br18]